MSDRLWPALTAIAGIVAASTVVLLAVTTFTLVGRPPTSYSVLLVAFIGLLSGLSIGVLALYLRRARAPRPLKIALAGMPGVGKTAYVNVAYRILMDGITSPLQFTADVKTARAVFSVAKNLQFGRWPAPTTTDGIRLYRGMLERPTRATFRGFVQGRSRVSLEIGDSAGEIWDEVTGEIRNQESWSLIDSTFFDYVIEADSVAYFIPSDYIVNSSDAVAESVEDIISTIQLLRAAQPTKPGELLEKSVAVVISKSDLLSEEQLDLLMRRPSMYGRNIDEVFGVPGAEFWKSLNHIERLRHVLARSVRSESIFSVSTLNAARGMGLADERLALHAGADPAGNDFSVRAADVLRILDPIIYAQRVTL